MDLGCSLETELLLGLVGLDVGVRPNERNQD